MAFEEDVKKMNVKGIITGAIISALGFLMAFQWRDVIKETINTFVPSGQGLLYLYISAIIVTIIAIAVTYILIKIQSWDIVPDAFEEKLKQKKQQLKKSAKSKITRK